MTFPKEHYQIVKALYTEGRFLLEGEAAFITLRENREYYQQFFHESFRLELLLTAEYALLKSSKDKDNLARSICIFLAILCYELDHDGGNLLETLTYKQFNIEEWDDRFEQSSFHNVMEATEKLRNPAQRKKFYQQLNRRSVIHLRDDGHFQFTAAHRYFLDFARGLHLMRSGEVDADH